MKVLALLALTVFVAGCNHGHSPEITAAIESLDRVQAATEVGPTYESYSNLVIDAKVKVTAAMAAENDETLRSDLNSALDNYEDAATIWSAYMRGEKLNVRREPGRSILPQYSLTVDDEGNIQNEREAVKYVWRRAYQTLVKIKAHKRSS